MVRKKKKPLSPIFSRNPDRESDPYLDIFLFEYSKPASSLDDGYCNLFNPNQTNNRPLRKHHRGSTAKAPGTKLDDTMASHEPDVSDLLAEAIDSVKSEEGGNEPSQDTKDSNETISTYHDARVANSEAQPGARAANELSGNDDTVDVDVNFTNIPVNTRPDTKNIRSSLEGRDYGDGEGAAVATGDQELDDSNTHDNTNDAELNAALALTQLRTGSSSAAE